MSAERFIAVEEHIATEQFLDMAHSLDVFPGDRAEIQLMRTVESTGSMRVALADIDGRLAMMDAVGQSMAVLSINPPGVQPYLAMSVNLDVACR